MTSTSSRNSLRIIQGNHGTASISVTGPQLPDVRAILDANSIPYWVEEMAISFDGGPLIWFLRLEGKCDVPAVRRLLDTLSP